MPAKNSGLRFFVFYGQQVQAKCRELDDAFAMASAASARHINERVSVWNANRILATFERGVKTHEWSPVRQSWMAV